MAASPTGDVRTIRVFSGKEEQWVSLDEYFAAKMFVQNLHKVLKATKTAQSLFRLEPATEKELKAATEPLKEKKHAVWFELVNVLEYNLYFIFFHLYKGA